MFPVWIILLALILALYVIIWALVAALYAMVAAFAAVAVSSIPGSIHLFVQGRNSEAVLVIAVGIFLAGLTVAMIIGSNAAARGAARLTKRVALGFKSIFVKKRTPEKTVEGGAQA